MALAVYHEALNQGDRGQRAVIHVILNRMKDGRWPTTACGVVFQKKQFSFMTFGMKKLVPKDREHWKQIVKLVYSMQSDCGDDLTRGSNHFYNPRIARPCWPKAKGKTKIGAHMFVRI